MATIATTASAVANRSSGVARYDAMGPVVIPDTSSVGSTDASEAAILATTRAATTANIAPTT